MEGARGAVGCASARPATLPSRRPRIIRRVIALALLLLSVLPVASASAGEGQALVFDARRDLFDPGRREAALDELQQLGVRDLRLLVYWKDVAPAAEATRRPDGDLADPATYAWGRYDEVMAAARARGMRVLVTLTLPGPKWAMRDKKDFLTYPSASLFGRFAEAVGRRYGDQVGRWAIGNEPNHPDFLRPQYRKGEAVSPRLYRQLFRAATKGLERSGNGEDDVLFGETLPRGRRGASVAPLAFLRQALCLDRAYRKRPSCGRLDFDGFAHHPYTTKAGPFFVSPNRDDVTIGTLSRLTSALDRAARAGAVRERMPIWLTEFGVQSTPDRFTGVSLEKQVEWRSIAERLAYGNDRVRGFSQYLLTDDPPVEGVAASKRYGGFESGLRFSTGRNKPSFDGFRLPLAALRKGSRVSLWGMVRPAGGVTTAEILVQDGGRTGFRRLKTVRTDARGVFTTTTTYKRGREFRLRWRGTRGAPVRVYTR